MDFNGLADPYVKLHLLEPARYWLVSPSPSPPNSGLTFYSLMGLEDT